LVPALFVRYGVENEIQSPMAVVVLGGLLTAVVLNMLVVPALFLRCGVERPGGAASLVQPREMQLVLEGVG
jgi:Cu/Ag efflux pump CusA